MKRISGNVSILWSPHAHKELVRQLHVILSGTDSHPLEPVRQDIIERLQNVLNNQELNLNQGR